MGHGPGPSRSLSMIFLRAFFCLYNIISFGSPSKQLCILSSYAQKVRLEISGRAQLTGTTVKKLIPNGQHPSIAYFDDIMISPPGKYRLQIVSVMNPNKVYVAAMHDINVGTSRRWCTTLGVSFHFFFYPSQPRKSVNREEKPLE